MKKIFIALLLIVSGFYGYSQSTTVDYATYDSNGMAFKKRTDTIITPPYNANYFFNGNKIFQKFDSTVRLSISYTGQNYLSYNSTTGVLTGSQINLTTNVTNVLPVANGGTGTSTPGIVAGTNITVTGTWPNQTINSSGGGGSGWSLTGNSGLTYGTNYLGTSDTSTVHIKTKAIDRAVFDTLGRVTFNGIAPVANSTDSATLQVSPRGISFRRSDGLTRGTSIGLDASDNFRIQGNGSGLSYKEGSTTEFSVNTTGVGSFNGALSSGGKISTTLSSGINGDFNAGGGGAQFNLPNNVQIGGSANIYSTQSAGPTFFGLKFNSWSGAAYVDRWWMDQDGALSTVATIVPSAIVNANSTTRGFLPPVQTTTQVNAGGVSTGTLVGGSGYTNGAYDNKYLTGGSGSGVYANFTISGGAVTAVTITYEGAGYVVGDVLSYSTGIGAGSGFTYTVTAITNPATGLQKYNSTSNTNNTYNGTNWVGQSTSSSAGTLTLTHGSDYTFTGTTSTYTLPAPSSTLLGRQNGIIIVNLGSGSITLNSASGSEIIPTASTTAQASLTITTGQSCELFPTGTAFKVLYLN